MTRLEKILKEVPVKRLDFQVDALIKKEIYKKIREEKVNNFYNVFSFGSPILRRSVAFIVVIVFFVTSTSVYAYNSNGVTIGHPLFLIKEKLEKTELDLVKTEEKKVKKLIKFSQKRLAEARVVTENKNLESANNLDKIIDYSVENFQKAETIENNIPDRAVLHDLINREKEANLAAVEKIAEEKEVFQKEDVKNSIDHALEFYSAIKKFDDKNQDVDEFDEEVDAERENEEDNKEGAEFEKEFEDEDDGGLDEKREDSYREKSGKEEKEYGEDEHEQRGDEINKNIEYQPAGENEEDKISTQDGVTRLEVDEDKHEEGDRIWEEDLHVSDRETSSSSIKGVYEERESEAGGDDYKAKYEQRENEESEIMKRDGENKKDFEEYNGEYSNEKSEDDRKSEESEN